MQHRISPCLWFNTEAEDAAKFYTSVFSDAEMLRVLHFGKAGSEGSGQPEGLVMTAEFRIANLEFVALNGGPVFKPNPSISFFVVAETEEESDLLWNRLSEGGMVMMPYQAYDWAEKYGFLQDKFGVSWQISWGKLEDTGGDKIIPSLMFTKQGAGRAEEAVQFYATIFSGHQLRHLLKYGPGEAQQEGMVMHGQFNMEGQEFMVMDSSISHEFSFSIGVSLVINCENQAENDYFYDALVKGGEESQCGWLKDKFGVSWQVVPVELTSMMTDPDKEKAERATKAMMQMKKIDMEKIRAAFEGVSV